MFSSASRKLGVLTLLSTCSLAISIGVAGEPTAPKETDDPVERGRHLVVIAGCNDCHSPKVMSPNGPVPHPMKIAFRSAGRRCGFPRCRPVSLLPTDGWQ